MLISCPLGISMIAVGAYSLQHCSTPLASTMTITNPTPDTVSDENENVSQVPFLMLTVLATWIFSIQDDINAEMHHIPIWLVVAGTLVVLVPAVYFIYDVFCKPEDVNPSKSFFLIGWRNHWKIYNSRHKECLSTCCHSLPPCWSGLGRCWICLDIWCA